MVNGVGMFFFYSFVRSHVFRDTPKKKKKQRELQSKWDTTTLKTVENRGNYFPTNYSFHTAPLAFAILRYQKIYSEAMLS